jgi:hypothetical protein
MARRTPIEVFEDSIADAERLVALTRMLLNTRRHRMRLELRERVGEAMRLPKRDRDKLDCVESADVFVVLKPNGSAARAHFTEPELRPLLRQAVVAIGAAVEAYVADKACGLISEALKAPPKRMLTVPVSLEQVLELERYERRGWGHRRLLRNHLELNASSSPKKIGEVFGTVGKSGFWKKVDSRRKVSAGTSEKQLQALCERRNRIAHTADRQGRGRAHLELRDVEKYLVNAREIVEALDAVL